MRRKSSGPPLESLSGRPRKHGGNIHAVQMTAARPQMTARKRRGDTCVARMTAARPRMAARKRGGDIHVARRTAACPRMTARKRRGDTCVARMTVARPQMTGRKRRGDIHVARMAGLKFARPLCRQGRPEWRPYDFRSRPGRPASLPRTGFLLGLHVEAVGQVQRGVGRHRVVPRLRTTL